MHNLRLFKPSKLHHLFSFYFSTSTQRPNINHILKQYSSQLQQTGIMQKMVPRQFDQQKLSQLSVNQRFTGNNNHISSLNQTFSQPIWDLLDRGGKRWRPVLAMLLAELYQRPRSDVHQLAAFCEIIHNGSLIIDDIEDDSDIRRNKPCVHKIYGIDIAINAGNFMYFVPMLHLYNSKNYSKQLKQEFVQIYLQEIVQLHIGQGWDILWHNPSKIQENYPTQAQYLQMTAHKTGVLARLISRMVCALVNAPKRQREIISEFVENIGVAFQIQDDLLNLQGEQFKQTKGYNGEDIHQGKITLMVINHIQKAPKPARDRFLEILKLKTLDPVLIQQAISLLKSSGSLDYAKELMASMIQKAKHHIDSHFPQSQTRQLLKQLAQFGIKRQK